MNFTQTKIAVFGSLTEDLFVEPEQAQIMTMELKTGEKQKYMVLPYGAKLSAQYLETRYGGGCSNVSVALSCLGYSTMAFGAVGDDSMGERICENFNQHNVRSDGVVRLQSSKSGSALIITAYDGERTVVFSPESNRKFEDYSSELLFDFSPEFLHLCHLSASKDSLIRQKLFQYIQESDSLCFSWNPGRSDISLGIDYHSNFLKKCFFLFLNAEEAEEFSQKDRIIHDQFDDFSEIASVFLKKGVAHVIITDGQKGAMIYSQHEKIFIPTVDSPRVSTLGAGDAFASGFLGGWIYRKNLQFAGKCASMLAASVVSKRGAQEGLLSGKQLFI